MLDVNGSSWYNTPLWFRYGLIFKKKKILKKSKNLATEEEVEILRTVPSWISAEFLTQKEIEGKNDILRAKCISIEQFPNFYNSFQTI